MRPDDWPEWRRLRRAALAEAPDAFSSTLAEWSGPGDTEERWRARLTDVPYNAVAYIGDQPMGVVGSRLSNSSDAELVSMWVAPSGRGRGVGDALVQAVFEWASTRGARSVALDVRQNNQPAIDLYVRNGFRHLGPSPDADPSAPPEIRMVFDMAAIRT